MAHKTIEEYLKVMKQSYQIALIRPFYKNLRKELTKMPKVYFYDLGLRNFLVDNYALPEKLLDKGNYLENIAFRENYPNIPLKFLTYEQLLESFYPPLLA